MVVVLLLVRRGSVAILLLSRRRGRKGLVLFVGSWAAGLAIGRRRCRGPVGRRGCRLVRLKFVFPLLLATLARRLKITTRADEPM